VLHLPGTGREIMADQTREEIDAKIAAAEARGDTKIARLESKIDLVLTKLDDVTKDYRSLRANIWTAGLIIIVVIIAVIIAVAALFSAFFNVGAHGSCSG
jgi:hypothetical protein